MIEIPGYELIAFKPKVLSDIPFTYCPGCGHGIVHRIIAEILEELGIAEKTIAVWPIGCSVLAYKFFKLDCVLASHGRAPAVATGVVCSRRLDDPDTIVFTYQGDGDLASIGLCEIIHAANRGENITTIFINNAVYGMTGGQMAPTTLLGQKTATTPKGRDPKRHGYPLRVCEILDKLTAPVYIERVGAFLKPVPIKKDEEGRVVEYKYSLEYIVRVKKAIRKAFELQKAKKGFTFVEVLSSCPASWRIKPDKCGEWMEENMVPVFPLRVFREPAEDVVVKLEVGE